MGIFSGYIFAVNIHSYLNIYSRVKQHKVYLNYLIHATYTTLTFRRSIYRSIFFFNFAFSKPFSYVSTDTFRICLLTIRNFLL